MPVYTRERDNATYRKLAFFKAKGLLAFKPKSLALKLNDSCQLKRLRQVYDAFVTTTLASIDCYLNEIGLYCWKRETLVADSMNIYRTKRLSHCAGTQTDYNISSKRNMLITGSEERVIICEL